MQGKLKDKVAIVTGAGTGIGEAIAKKFALEGAFVVVVGFPDDPIDDVANAIRADGGRSIAFKGDISEEADARACVRAALDSFGKVDILINNAGVFPTFEETQNFPDNAYFSLIKNNIQSAFMMTRAALPYLQESKGNIVSAGSEAGHAGINRMTPYGGTKAFIHAFMKGVAQEQAQYGVRANVVAPGPIDTAWLHKETGPRTAADEKMAVENTLMGRIGTPEEIANVYCFLASDDASFVTGAIWDVNGGSTLARGNIGKNADESLKEEPIGVLELEHSQDGKPERL